MTSQRIYVQASSIHDSLLSRLGVFFSNSGRILGLRPANERRRYFVTTSLIGWMQA